MQDLSKEDLAKAESAGFPIVLLILLAVFGSFAAAALPLALGVGSVLVTGALIFGLSQAMEMSVFVTNMASMIGIGVAVDYSLFIVARYREEIARRALARRGARAWRMATSGLAVLFSGLTVIISLAGLWMIDNTAIRSMALGRDARRRGRDARRGDAAAGADRVLGRRVTARSRLFSARPLAAPHAADGPGFWQRWTDAVMRRPVVAAAGSAAVLLALAAPVLGIETENGALDQFPRDHEVARGFEAAAAVAGAGRVLAGPRRRRARTTAPRRGRAAGRVRAALEREPGVAGVAEPVRVARRRARCCSSPQTRGEPESGAAKATVERLRAALPAAGGRRRAGRRRRRDGRRRSTSTT